MWYFLMLLSHFYRCICVRIRVRKKNTYHLFQFNATLLQLCYFKILFLKLCGRKIMYIVAAHDHHNE